MQSNFLNKRDHMFFENIQDMVKFLKEAPLQGDPSRDHYSSIEGDSSFYGKYTYDESLDRLQHGDEELANSIEEIKDQTIMTEKILQSFKIDVHGFMPSVPHAVMGLPQSMINIQQHRIKGNNKIIDLVLDGDVSCTVSSESYTKVVKTFLNVVDALERQGYRLNLYWALNTDMECTNTKVCWILKLKDSTEPFNRYKCAFPLGSVSMFRRIGFRLIETLPSGNAIKDQRCGYGRPGRHSHSMISEGLSLVNINPKNLYIFKVDEYLGSSAEDIMKKIKGDK